jgi:hypothetical protein
VAARAARHEHDTTPRDEATIKRQQQQHQHSRRTAASSLKQSKSCTWATVNHIYSADQPTPKIAPSAPPTKTKCRCPHLALSGS